MDMTCNDDSEQTEVCMLELLDAKFKSGEGVLLLHPNMAEDVLVSLILNAASHGMPFRVVPAGQ